jgi:hypothetical protein
MYQRFSIIALLLTLTSAGCSTTGSSHAVTDVPDALKPAGNESLAMIVPATGVQIYECRLSAQQPGRYEWAFVAPDAELFDRRGKRIGRHYAGPHWEAVDGSKIVATVKARADAPRGDAVPWLLLNARSVGRDGAFSKVTSIQRANTVGGMAPEDGCSQATLGAPARIAYTADYYFFSAR